MYKSIDSLQKALSQDVFSYTADAKKAAGRSLGTLVEIITFYLLREWGLLDSISIERGLPEYGAVVDITNLQRQGIGLDARSPKTTFEKVKVNVAIV